MIKIFLKFFISFGILFWLIRNGSLDFSLLGKSAAMKTEWFIALCLLILQVSISAFRWRNLLNLHATRSLSFFKVLKITWIGLLFNTILPGAVTGDLVKVLYAKNLDEKFSKTYLLTSTFIDRILGLFGLLSLLGISSSLFYSEIISKSSVLERLIHFNLFLFIGMIFFLLTMILPHGWQQKSLSLFDKIPLLGTYVKKFFVSFWSIGKHQKTIWFSIGISVFGHALSVLAFWILASPFFEVSIPVQYGFTFIPLGLASTAIPITPSGLGLGHAIFGELFAFFGTNNGQSLFNFYFITLVSVNLLGLIPYLLIKSKKPLEKNN